jgi:hypothetical protein
VTSEEFSLVTGRAHGLTALLESAETSRSMPEANDFQTIIRIVYAIDDAIRSKNNFTQLRVPEFGDDTATLRKCR